MRSPVDRRMEATGLRFPFINSRRFYFAESWSAYLILWNALNANGEMDLKMFELS